MILDLTWFVLVVVLVAGYAILDGFDLGVGFLHLLVPRSEEERRLSLASVAPVWDGNEVWLLTAGGALFAAGGGCGQSNVRAASRCQRRIRGKFCGLAQSFPAIHWGDHAGHVRHAGRLLAGHEN